MAKPMSTMRQAQIQGQILLERALFCIGCEVIFTGTVHCPRCGGGTVWPLAEWLRSARSPSGRALRSESPTPDIQRAPQARQALPAA
jgi:hypothetical protein